MGSAAGSRQLRPSFRVWPAITAVLLAGLGVLIFLFARGFLRGFVSDVLVVGFLVACPAALGLGRPWMRLVAVGTIAVLTEGVQALGLVGKDAHWLLHLTVGATFDPLDLVAYAVGLGIAAGMEWGWSRTTSPPRAS